MIQENYFVYLHRNLTNGKRYYGITSEKYPEERWRKGYSHNRHLSAAFEKYGWNGFEHIVVAKGLTKAEAEQMEVQRQNDVNSLNAKDMELSKAITDGDRAITNEVNKLRVDMEVGDIEIINELNTQINDQIEYIRSIADVPTYNLGEITARMGVTEGIQSVFNEVSETGIGRILLDRVYEIDKPLVLERLNDDIMTSIEIYGGGCINDVVIHLATSEMGFGGVGESGMGSYHGKEGFDAFSHYKSIVDKKTWIDLPMRYQPYNKYYEKLLKLFLR